MGMIDMMSYILGNSAGKGNVVIEGNGYTYTDPESDGNIVITENEGEDS